MFYTYTTVGNMFFHQPQIDPKVLLVMQIANSDPMVNAFCLHYRISDAHQLYTVLQNEYFNKRAKEIFKGLTQAEIEKLQRENPEYEYQPTTCSMLRNAVIKDFVERGLKPPRHQGFYYREVVESRTDANTGSDVPTKARQLYQCEACGLVIWDHEDPETINDRISGRGHSNGWRHAKFPTSEDCTEFREKQNNQKTWTVNIKLHETLSHGRDPVTGIETVEIITSNTESDNSSSEQEHQ